MTLSRIAGLIPALLLFASPAIAQDAPAATTPTDAQAIDDALRADRAVTPPPVVVGLPGRGAFLQQSLILNGAGGWFSTASPLQTGDHDLQRSGLTLQGLEWTSTAHVDPYFYFTGVVTFALGGVEIEEAFAQTTALPGNLQLKLGQFLLPVGRLNTQHLHAWHFADQPLHLGRVFGSEGGRGLGAQVSWLAPLPWSCEVIAAGTAAAGEGADGVIGDPKDALGTVHLKQYWQLGDDWGVQFGATAQYGAIRHTVIPWDKTGSKRVVAADLLLRWRPLADPERPFATLAVEVLHATPPNGDPGVPGIVGGVAQLVYGIDARWETGLRSERVQDDESGEWPQQRHSLLLSWKPTEFSRLRLQGNLARNSDFAAWESGAFLALEVFTGDHAAHPW